MDKFADTFNRWLVVLLLMSATIFSVVDRFALPLLLEPIKTDLKITDAQFGLLNGVAFGLFYAGMGMPLGWLADRWSRKGTILLGIGLWSLSTGLCGAANNFGQLLAARIGVGAGEAGLSPISFTIVHDRFPRHLLSRAMSVLQIGAVIGSGVALLVCGFVYQFFAGGGGAALPLIGALKPWQQTFTAVAMPGILFIVLIALLRIPRPEPAAAATPGAGAGVIAVLRADARTYGLMFFGMSGVIAVHYSLLSWTPAVLVREMGWTPKDVGAAYGLAVGLVSPLGLLAGGWFADHLARREVRAAHAWITVLAVVLAVPCALLLPWVGRAEEVVAVAACLHFALGLPIGVVPAFVQLLTPTAVRARVSAVYVFTVNFVGLGVAPVVIGSASGLFSQPQGLRLAMSGFIWAALAVSAAIFTLLLSGLRRRRA